MEHRTRRLAVCAATGARLELIACAASCMKPCMLIDCPECGRSVSDRAPACPDCGFPVAAELALAAAQKVQEEEKQSRTADGRTDCPTCTARGFQTFDEVDDDGSKFQTFAWCARCEHSGRITLCRSTRGYWAVADQRVDEFLKGAIGEDHDDVTFVGDEAPPPRYPAQQNDGSEGTPG